MLMLREGWDVPEVGVILLLRKFSSIEVKNPALIDSPSVQRKRSAAEAWCAARRMAYRIATLE